MGYLPADGRGCCGIFTAGTGTAAARPPNPEGAYPFGVVGGGGGAVPDGPVQHHPFRGVDGQGGGFGAAAYGGSRGGQPGRRPGRGDQRAGGGLFHRGIYPFGHLLCSGRAAVRSVCPTGQMGKRTGFGHQLRLFRHAGLPQRSGISGGAAGCRDLLDLTGGGAPPVGAADLPGEGANAGPDRFGGPAGNCCRSAAGGGRNHQRGGIPAAKKHCRKPRNTI